MLERELHLRRTGSKRAESRRGHARPGVADARSCSRRPGCCEAALPRTHARRRRLPGEGVVRPQATTRSVRSEPTGSNPGRATDCPKPACRHDVPSQMSARDSIMCWTDSSRKYGLPSARATIAACASLWMLTSESSPPTRSSGFFMADNGGTLIQRPSCSARNVGIRLVERRSRSRDHEHGALQRRSDPGQHIEHAGSGPVKVLDRQHAPPRPSVGLEELPPRAADDDRDDAWLEAVERVPGHDDSGRRRQGKDRFLVVDRREW